MKWEQYIEYSVESLESPIIIIIPGNGDRQDSVKDR